MVLIPIGVAIYVTADVLIRRRPSDKVIVVVARLDGPDDHKALTSFLINGIKQATIGFPDIEIIGLSEVIGERAEPEVVTEIGRNHKASIVALLQFWWVADAQRRMVLSVGEERGIARTGDGKKMRTKVGVAWCFSRTTRHPPPSCAQQLYSDPFSASTTLALSAQGFSPSIWKFGSAPRPIAHVGIRCTDPVFRVQAG